MDEQLICCLRFSNVDTGEIYSSSSKFPHESNKNSHQIYIPKKIENIPTKATAITPIPAKPSISADVAQKIAIAPKISRIEPMIFLAFSGIISRMISSTIQKTNLCTHDTLGLLVALRKILPLQCD